MELAIETRELTKQWGRLTAVADLDLSIPAGECYASLGRNGAGKSTTARMLLDFIRPTRGTSQILRGRGSDPSVRARVGYLPGDLHLPRSMTGADAITFFGGLALRRRQRLGAVRNEQLGGPAIPPGPSGVPTGDPGSVGR